MSSGADLFVVCRQCGSEVSPYITECPYCGHRLRRRAPKLPRARGGEDGQRGGIFDGSLRRLSIRRTRAVSLERRPYATIALVLGACGLWVATTSGFLAPSQLAIDGPLQGQWWRLLTSQFLYVNGVYAFVALFAVAVFGWLLERRHGPLVVIALFLGCGVTGGLVADAAYAQPLVVGANAAALGLLAAWAAPDIRSLRRREWYEGDLIGAAAVAAALLAMPLARPEASWLSGVAGGAVGLVVGFGIDRVTSTSEL